MKTRIFALGLAVLLVFTMLAGCSDGNSGAGSDSSTGSSQPAPAQQDCALSVSVVASREAPPRGVRGARAAARTAPQRIWPLCLL